MPDAALDGPVSILAREFAGLGTGFRVRPAVGVASERKMVPYTNSPRHQFPTRHASLLLSSGSSIIRAFLILQERSERLQLFLREVFERRHYGAGGVSRRILEVADQPRFGPATGSLSG